MVINLRTQRVGMIHAYEIWTTCKNSETIKPNLVGHVYIQQWYEGVDDEKNRKVSHKNAMTRRIPHDV